MPTTIAEQTTPDALATPGNSGAVRLQPQQLARACEPATLGFRTTDELRDGSLTLGQDRAVSAIQFAV